MVREYVDEIWGRHDKDGSGKLNQEEGKELMIELGMACQSNEKTAQLVAKTVWEDFVAESDLDGDKMIDKEEFSNWMAQVMNKLNGVE